VIVIIIIQKCCTPKYRGAASHVPVVCVAASLLLSTLSGALLEQFSWFPCTYRYIWMSCKKLVWDLSSACAVSTRCDVSLPSLQREGEMQRKNYLGLLVKGPSLLTDYSATCINCSTGALSHRCQVSVS
jgi:hypothetical protein